MESFVVTDFEKVCRICMKFDKTFLSITSFQIIDMIIAFASVQIWENDDLPNQICHACFLQLQNTINFKQLCENSDGTFRQIIRQKRINLSHSQNNLNKVKDEDFEDFEDYADDNSCIDVKEEDIKENVIVGNSLENVKIKIDHNKAACKLETNNLLQIKNEDKPELNTMQISTKSGKESDTSENIENIYNDENGKETFTCEKCDKEFKKIWVLGQHMHRKHRSKALKCNKCELKFYHSLHLKEHQELTHNTTNLTCNICKKVFTKIYELKRHKFRHSSLHCQRCDKSFKDKCSLKHHNKEVHSKIEKFVTCHICGKCITKKNLHHHLATHEEREKITCDKCSKTFINQLTFKKHIKEVHGKKIRKHLCNICGHASRSPADLRKHLLTHSDERPHKCDRCDKTYGRPDYLKQHISHVHLNQRKFQCKFCSQAFYERRTLVHHERRHTGEKPHECQMCGKSFAEKTSLMIHMKTHTNSSEKLIQILTQMPAVNVKANPCRPQI